MLTENQLATVRAALRYWRDEMVPAGATARFYFDVSGVPTPTALDIDALLASFHPEVVRYGLISDDGQCRLFKVPPARVVPNSATLLFGLPPEMRS